MAKKNSLEELFEHPSIRKDIDWKLFRGLSGYTRTDYVIGVIERAMTDPKNMSDVILQEMVGGLRRDPNYRKYF